MSEPAFEDDERFEILDKLAEGGMGVVYRARHVGLDKMVALKVLNTTYNDDTAIVRFQNEAKTLSRLSHRSIAGVYDFGVSKSGEPFMAIEFIQGVTLQDLLDVRGRLTVDEALPLFIQIADALAHAHQRGVVHRDIKPSNIIIQVNDDEMLAKVVDFGISKDSLSDKGDLTRTGGLIGSPLYMSPEQTLGHLITPQADMYSLGCLIYHSLIGEPPFAGETIFDTIKQHRDAPIPSMRKLRAEIPQELDEIVGKLLSKEPEKRYLSMTVVEKILTRILEGTVGDSQGNPIIVEDTEDEDERAEMLKATLLIDSGKDTNSTKKIAIGIILVGIAAVFSVAIALKLGINSNEATSKKIALDDVRAVVEAPPDAERDKAIRKMIRNGTTEYGSMLWSPDSVKDDDMKVFQGTKVAKDIHFSELQIGDKALKYLVDSPITRLDLTNTNVKTLEYLPGQKTLEFLQLTGTKVGDEALARLVTFEKLNCLLLDETQVTAAGIRKHLKTIPLNELRVFDCPNVSAADIDALANEFPMWKIEPWRNEFKNKNLISVVGDKCNLLAATGKPQKAIEEWKKWSEFADAHKDSDPKRRLKIRALTSLSAIYSFIKNREQAKKMADEAIALATQYGGDRQLAEAYNALFRHYLNAQDIQLAAETGKKAVEWSEKAYQEPEMQLSMDVGTVLANAGKPAEAIPILEKSLRAREKWKASLEGEIAEKRANGDRVNEYDMENIRNNRGSLAVTYLHYSNCLRALQRNVEAKEAVKKSISILEEIPNPAFSDYLGHDYMALADTLIRLKDFNKALTASSKAIPIYKTSKNPILRQTFLPLATKQRDQIKLMIKANPTANAGRGTVPDASKDPREKPGRSSETRKPD